MRNSESSHGDFTASNLQMASSLEIPSERDRRQGRSHEEETDRVDHFRGGVIESSSQDRDKRMVTCLRYLEIAGERMTTLDNADSANRLQIHVHLLSAKQSNLCPIRQKFCDDQIRF